MSTKFLLINTINPLVNYDTQMTGYYENNNVTIVSSDDFEMSALDIKVSDIIDNTFRVIIYKYGAGDNDGYADYNPDMTNNDEYIEDLQINYGIVDIPNNVNKLSVDPMSLNNIKGSDWNNKHKYKYLVIDFILNDDNDNVEYIIRNEGAEPEPLNNNIIYKNAINLWFSNKEDAINKYGNISDWDVSNVTDMSYTFANKLFNDDISKWDISNVIDMSYMFAGTSNFNQDISLWNTSSVINMVGMFKGNGVFNKDINKKLINEDTNDEYTAWDTSNVTNMSNMFNYSNFNQPINDWNTSNVINMSNMFGESAFNQPLNKWDTLTVTDMSNMFNYSKFNQPINDWNTSNVINMGNMFGESNFNQPLNKWNTSTVTNMIGMFNGATAFNQNINDWNTSKVLDMYNMFDGATNFNQPLNDWNTSKVFDMGNMFDGATNFNQPLNDWNTLTVTDMSNMFNGATNFNQPLNDWNTSKVFDMSNMFNGATNFNQDISDWDTLSVTNMEGMFNGATKFNQPISSWNVSKVTNMIGMFKSALKFDQNINRKIINEGTNNEYTAWDTSKVLDMKQMFQGSNFNQPLDKWNVSKVTNMKSMFRDSIFNQDISNWNTSIVMDMSDMFRESFFNQDINNWDTSSVINMSDMFNGANIFNQPLYKWNTSSVINMYQMFKNAVKFNQNINKKRINEDDNEYTAWDTSNVLDMSGMFAFERYTVKKMMLIIKDFISLFFKPNMIKKIIKKDGSIPDILLSEGPLSIFFSEIIIKFIDSIGTDNKFTFGIKIDEQLINMIVEDFSLSGIEIDFDILKNFFLDSEKKFIEFFQNEIDIEKFDSLLWQIEQPINDNDYIKIPFVLKELFDKNINSTEFNQPLNDWDVSSVIDMSNMFLNATEFNQPLNNWNIENVDNMDQMFLNAESFNQDISMWYVNYVSSMDFIFYNAKSFDQDLTSWGYPKINTNEFSIINMNDFNKVIKSLDSVLSDAGVKKSERKKIIKTLNPESLESMFKDILIKLIPFLKIYLEDEFVDNTISELNNINGLDNIMIFITSFFDYKTKLYNSKIFNTIKTPWFGISNVIDDNNFEYAISLYYAKKTDGSADTEKRKSANDIYGHISFWEVSRVTDMSNAFENNTEFNEDISRWDTSAVEDMSYMFSGATSFNQKINTSKKYYDDDDEEEVYIAWNVEYVEDMSHMFSGATSFNESLNDWNIIHVEDMSHMFSGATSFDKPLDKWNLEHIEYVNDIFENEDIEDIFNADKIIFDLLADDFSTGLKLYDFISKDLTSMFDGATNFNQDISMWNVKYITSMTDMFKDAKSFNKSLNNWNCPKVYDYSNLVLDDTIYENMFNGADKFNQNIDAPWIGSSNIMADINFKAAIELWFTNRIEAENLWGHISLWDVSKVTDMSSTFKNRSEFNEDISEWNTKNVTNMEDMFNGATKFNKKIGLNYSHDINEDYFYSSNEFYDLAPHWGGNINKIHWNTFKVQNMKGFLKNASSFDKWYELKLNTSNVTNMNEMFYGTTDPNISFLYQYKKIKRYSLSSVNLLIEDESITKKTMKENRVSSTLWNDDIIAEIEGKANDINSLNIYFGTYLHQDDFDDNGNLINLGSKHLFEYGALSCKIWDTSRVTNMSGMFGNTNLICNLDIPLFNLIKTHNVTNMSGMLRNNDFTNNLSYMNLNNCNDINGLVKSEYPSHLKPKILLIKELLLNNNFINEDEWSALNILINKDKLIYQDDILMKNYNKIIEDKDKIEINTINSDFLKNNLLKYTDNNSELFKLYCQHKIALFIDYSIKNNNALLQQMSYIIDRYGIDFSISDISFSDFGNVINQKCIINKFHIQFNSTDLIGKQIIDDSYNTTDNIKYILNSFVILDILDQTGKKTKEYNTKEYNTIDIFKSFIDREENADVSNIVSTHFVPLYDYEKLIIEYTKYLNINLFFMFYNLKLLTRHEGNDVACFTLLNENEFIALRINKLLLLCVRTTNKNGNEKYYFKIKNTNKSDVQIELTQSQKELKKIDTNSIQTFENLSVNTTIKIDKLNFILGNGRLLINPEPEPEPGKTIQELGFKLGDNLDIGYVDEDGNLLYFFYFVEDDEGNLVLMDAWNYPYTWESENERYSDGDGFFVSFESYDPISNSGSFILEGNWTEVPLGSNSFKLVQESKLTINLNKGWNLIGSSYDGIIEDSESIIIPNTLYAYDNSYVTSTEINANKGYWIKCNNEGKIYLNIDETTKSTNIQVNKGWNLIGSSIDGTLEDTESIIIPNTLYAYDNSYVNSTEINANKGYWIKCINSGTIKLQ